MIQISLPLSHGVMWLFSYVQNVNDTKSLGACRGETEVNKVEKRMNLQLFEEGAGAGSAGGQGGSTGTGNSGQGSAGSASGAHSTGTYTLSLIHI